MLALQVRDGDGAESDSRPRGSLGQPHAFVVDVLLADCPSGGMAAQLGLLAPAKIKRPPHIGHLAGAGSVTEVSWLQELPAPYVGGHVQMHRFEPDSIIGLKSTAMVNNCQQIWYMLLERVDSISDAHPVALACGQGPEVTKRV